MHQLYKFLDGPNSKHLQSIFHMTQAVEYVIDRVENPVGKGRKCWLPAFSAFPTLFPKPHFIKVAKIRD